MSVYTVYIKAVRNRDNVGFVMLWPEHPELTSAGIWSCKQDDTDTIEYKLCSQAKHEVLEMSRDEPVELVVYCTNPSAYVCLDPRVSIKFKAHDPHNKLSMEAVAAALHYAKP